MKRFLSAVLLGLSALTVASVSMAASDDYEKINKVLSQHNADRLLLVAFNDNTIGSAVKGTAAPNSYRNRGEAYQSSTWSERITDGLADDYDLEKLAEWPMTEVGAHCVVFEVEDKSTLASTLERLAKDDRVEIAQSMNVFKTKATTEKIGNDPYLKLQTNLQQMQIELAHGKSTGKNITIGMIDTGVDLEHPDLVGQVSLNKNLVTEVSSSFVTDKHGTAVAGIMVARKDNSQGIIGIAPSAKLVALKACWPDKNDAMEAVCNSYSLAVAVNTAIKMGIDVLNMSLAGPKDAVLTLLLNKAIKEGIIVVAADTGTGDANESFPASLDGVLSVQATKSSAPPVVTSKSLQAGSIAAPGEKILTTLPYGTYDFISGSSIAAAEVSGVVALLLELKPELSGSQARSILQESKLLPKEGMSSGINANVAVTSLCKSEGCSPQLISFAKINNPF